mmetsp:Transcript_5157/g.7847  ORF Transcript_5157/g.7847 Transcript_5157/m.7847 type:complete len:215 (-) Transcript_5157:149-793(-)
MERLLYCCSLPYRQLGRLECADVDVKCVILGDADSHKSDFMKELATEESPPNIKKDGKSMVLEAIKINAKIEGKQVCMALWDTPDTHAARVRIFPGTDAYILCFSVVSHASLEKMRSEYYRDIMKHDRQAPIILVGTRVELREDKDVSVALAERSQLPISRRHAEDVAQELGAEAYFECSLKHNPKIITDVLGEAVRCGMLSQSTREESSCTVQ